MKPVPNPWGWHHLSNVVWVEYPIRSGSRGQRYPYQRRGHGDRPVHGLLEELCRTRLPCRGYKIYLTGESYAGMYVPVHSHQLSRGEQDTTYFRRQGVLIYEPAIGDPRYRCLGGHPARPPLSNLPVMLSSVLQRYLPQSGAAPRERASSAAGTRFCLNKVPRLPSARDSSHRSASAWPSTRDGLSLPHGVPSSRRHGLLLTPPCAIRTRASRTIYQIAATCPLVFGHPGLSRWSRARTATVAGGLL